MWCADEKPEKGLATRTACIACEKNLKVGHIRLRMSYNISVYSVTLPAKSAETLCLHSLSSVIQVISFRKRIWHLLCGHCYSASAFKS